MLLLCMNYHSFCRTLPNRLRNCLYLLNFGLCFSKFHDDRSYFQIAEKCGYKRSLFDRLQMLQHGYRHMLNIQYRMKPTISHFPNSQFYEGKVKDGPNVMSPAYGNSLHNAAAFGPYAFLDCRHGVEVDQQKSWKNPKEVEVVRTLVTALGKGTYSKRPLEH
jgi:superfamily I DNA and/or RNA helicase